MSSTTINNPPIRIIDLIELKRTGSAVTSTPALDIIPVEFHCCTENLIYPQ